jgi:DNA modification methylase
MSKRLLGRYFYTVLVLPENTDHPAQEPEKLIAKLILASCPESGKAAVVGKR